MSASEIVRRIGLRQTWSARDTETEVLSDRPGVAATTLQFMDIIPTDAKLQQLLGHEADARDPAGAARRRRLTLEGLADADAADADADADAGLLIDDEAMQAWADSLGTDHELPIPRPS